ncbi:MAG: phosphodiester glycosidase family protein [Alphaproteobacteria bacterium]
MRKRLAISFVAAGACLVVGWGDSIAIAASDDAKHAPSSDITAPLTKSTASDAPSASSKKSKTGKSPLKWRELEPGLAFGTFDAHIPSPVGDTKIAVLRIDPKRFRFRLLSASTMKHPRALPIDKWMREHKLVAAINAGMFEPNGDTVGYSRVGNNVLKPHRKRNYGSYFLAGLSNGKGKAKLPAATILDAECDKHTRKTEKRYRIVMQSMRMISCKGENLWKKSQRIWSTAALAVDSEGNVLFIHSRSPWDVHDFIEVLIKMPLGITRAMYLEGGPEASLAIATESVNKMFLGSYETGLNENDSNTRAWALPNVIGIERIKNEKSQGQ